MVPCCGGRAQEVSGRRQGRGAAVSPAGRSVRLVLRPEAVRLDEESSYATGTISRVVYLGSTVEYDIAVEGTNLQAVVSSPIEHGIHQVGDRVGVFFSPKVVHAITA